MDSKKIVYRETGIVAIGETICTCLMLGIYALLHKFSLHVLLGVIAGWVLAVGNFLFMAIIVSLAADRAEKQDVEGGQKLLQSSYPIRIIALGALLLVCALSGYFDVLAMAIPLLFVRPIITIAEFFRKKGD